MRVTLSNLAQSSPAVAVGLDVAKRLVLPAAVIAVGAVLGTHDHALAITVDSSNPLAQAADTTRTQVIVPTVEKIGGVGIAVGIGSMIFQPDKKEVMKYASGAALCGAGAVGGGWVYDRAVTPLNSAAGLELPAGHTHVVHAASHAVAHAAAHVHTLATIVSHVAHLVAYLPHF